MVGVKRRMELICSDKKRDVMFQGRVKSMKKKAYELSTLCGLDIGMIVCLPSGQIETVSWPNQDDDGKTLEDLIRTSRNQDAMRKKTVKVKRISKGETQNKVGESLLNEDMKSEKELRELAICLDSKIERVKQRIQYLKEENQHIHQPQVINDTSIEEYEIMDPDDLDYLLNKIIDQPVTPIHEDFGTLWPHDLPSEVQPTAATFASNNDTNYHSNIPLVMTTGGYPMSRQVMIGRAAFQDFTSNDQLSYNPYL